jgi:hypothetical protein
LLSNARDGEETVMGRADVLALASRKGCTETCAQGFLDGERYRNRGERPPGHALFGIGQYCLGFRAGYLGVPLAGSAEPYVDALAAVQPAQDVGEKRRTTVSTTTAVPQARRPRDH